MAHKDKIASMVVFVLLVCIMVGAEAGAETITVPDDYETIQKAIDAADKGCTIVVAQGIYQESVSVNVEKLVIKSSDTAENTIIDAGKASNGVHVTANDVTLHGLTVKNAKEGGIYLDKVSGVRVTGNTVSENYSGIQLHSSQENLISSNTALGNSYYGIYLDSSDENEIKNNLASENQIGLLAYNGSKRNTIENNKSLNNSIIGIIVTSNGNIVAGNKVSGNRHGISLRTATRSDIRDNQISGGKIGVFIRRSSIENVITDNTISKSVMGIMAGPASGKNIIEENHLSEMKDSGITLLSSNNEIKNNTNENNKLGIGLGNCENNSVISNHLTNNEVGLLLTYANNNYIGENLIKTNEKGILFTGEDGAKYEPKGNEIHRNSITGNTKFGVINETETTIDATHNWWGNPSGPSGEGTGSGDAVSSFVSYEPWLKALPDEENREKPEKESDL